MLDTTGNTLAVAAMPVRLWDFMRGVGERTAPGLIASDLAGRLADLARDERYSDTEKRRMTETALLLLFQHAFDVGKKSTTT